MSTIDNEVQENEVKEEAPQKAWYVINTFGTQERRVQQDLEKRKESFHLEDKIFRIIVAEYEERVLDENGRVKMVKDKATGQMKEKVKVKNYYPGYIFVEMIMDDYTWYIVRNTPGVSGITGSSGKGAKPFPIPNEEIEPVLKRMHIVDPNIYSQYQIGDEVKIIDGMFRDSQGTISSINPENGDVTVTIMLFGRPNEIPTNFSEIEKVKDDRKYQQTPIAE